MVSITAALGFPSSPFKGWVRSVDIKLHQAPMFDLTDLQLHRGPCRQSDDQKGNWGTGAEADEEVFVSHDHDTEMRDKLSRAKDLQTDVFGTAFGFRCVRDLVSILPSLDAVHLSQLHPYPKLSDKINEDLTCSSKPGPFSPLVILDRLEEMQFFELCCTPGPGSLDTSRFPEQTLSDLEHVTKLKLFLHRSPWRPADNDLRGFLQHFPSLQSLTLKGKGQGDQVSKKTASDCLLQGTSWPCLRKLHVSGLKFGHDVFIDFMSKHVESLRTFIMNDTVFAGPEETLLATVQMGKLPMDLTECKFVERMEKVALSACPEYAYAGFDKKAFQIHRDWPWIQLQITWRHPYLRD